MKPRLTLETTPDPKDVQSVLDGLRAYNVAVIGPPNIESVAVFARDGSGRVLGGLLGEIKWRWLYVAKLWLADELRGEGTGRELMRLAEQHARERGCIGVHLDTFEYQALPFYVKLGYTLVGTLDGYPPGYKQHFLGKRLSYADEEKSADEK